MTRILEIRSYQLQAGSQDEFLRVMAEQSVPLLLAWGMDVVAFGPSLHHADAAYLMRAFDSVEHLAQSQDAFYATTAWREGPREAIVARIVSDANTTLELPEGVIDALRGPCAPQPAPVLSCLNGGGSAPRARR